MPTYATAADLDAWLPATVQVPVDVDVQLRKASRLVRAATLTAVYDTNPATDIALDPVVRDAFRDATCAQVETWLALGVDPAQGAAGATDGVVTSSGIGGASVGYAAGLDRVIATRQASVTGLGEEAVAILGEAGLLVGRVWAV